jgi:hypothetical protein
MSRRQQIADGLKDRLATILVTNGYSSDAGASVFLWRRHDVDPDETPCLLVQDSKLLRDSDKIIGQTRNLLFFEVVGVLSGMDATVARDLEEDVIQCLGGWESCGGFADRILVLASEVIMEQHGQLVGSVHLTLQAEYYTALNQC